MNRNTVSGVVLLLLLIGMSILAFHAEGSEINSFPYLKVEPEHYLARQLGEIVELNMTINDLDEDLHVIALRIEICHINNTVLGLVNVTEGDFMNNTLWAPYGTFFSWMEEVDYPIPGYSSIYMGCIINPNPETMVWDWGKFPNGSGVFYTLHFEILYQEEFPWKYTTLIDLCELFPHEIFMNSTYELVPNKPCIDGKITIVGSGYIMGDLNSDGKVDIQDMVLFIKAFGSYPTHPRWNVWADLKVDNKVDIQDLVLLIKNFGKHYP